MLRLSEPLTLEKIENALQRTLMLTTTRTPVGKLWLVDDRRIREFAEETGGDD